MSISRKKSAFCHMRKAKAKISLYIRAAIQVLRFMFHANNEDSDQTAQADFSLRWAHVRRYVSFRCGSYKFS